MKFDTYPVLRLLSIVLVLGLSVSGCGPSGDSSGPEEEPTDAPAEVDAAAAVRAVAESWDPLMNAGDLDGLVSLFADDGIRLNEGEPATIGEEAIRSGFAATLDGASIDASSPVEEIQVSGNWAFARGTYLDRSTNAGGETVEEAGKWLSIFRNTTDGWKYYVDIWNRDAPASAPARARETASTPLPEPVSSGGGSDADAIIELNDAWDVAFNARDIDALVATYTRNGRRLNPDEPEHVGEEAIRVSFESEFGANAEEETNAIVWLEVEGDWAYVVGTSSTESETSKWAAIVRRTPDGWKFYLDIWNRNG